MSTFKQDVAEEYVKRRYERWRRMAVPFAYKHTKSQRLAQILERTGGLTKTALELGVGPGGIARPLSRLGVGVVGMDLSWDALVRAKDHCKSDDVALLRGSGFALPFQDRSFPLVYASQVLHLFDNDGRLLLMKEAHRVLQPGGRFVFDMKNVTTHPWRYLSSSPERKRDNFPSRGRIRSLLGDAGFQDVWTLPGVFPLVGAANLPNLALLRATAHTTFFVAKKRPLAR